jgi:protein gp37
MGKTTEISWTDSTWSPIRARVKMDAPSIAKVKGYSSLVEIAMKMRGRVGQHCEHVSPGCKHCYAETNNHRCLPANGTGLPYDRRSRDLVEAFVDEKVLMQPLKWRPIKEQTAAEEVVGSYHLRPRRIFVENQSDLFGEWISDAMRDRVCAVGILSGHILQFLTKRAENMRRYFSNPETGNRIQDQVAELTEDYAFAWPYPNFWLGVSVENQTAADARIPILISTPAAVRFISAEPLLEAVSVAGYFRPMFPGDAPQWKRGSGLDWVICGGESGSKARPMSSSWADDVRQQCETAGAAFFHKQNGEFVDAGHEEFGQLPTAKYVYINSAGIPWGDNVPLDENSDVLTMKRVGRNRAGDTLFGKQYHQFPK